jgi:L,D-transpeptidase ErfK/SrfK
VHSTRPLPLRRTLGRAGGSSRVALALVFALASSGCSALGNVLVVGGAGGTKADPASLDGATKVHRIGRNETLIDVAVRYEVGYVELVAANPDVDAWLPKKGTKVLIPSKHLPPAAKADGKRIVINLADMRLYYYDGKGEPRSYAIGIGREGLTTPLGTTKIIRKQKDPTWRPTARMRREDPKLEAVVPPGPDNPMGSRALYLARTPYAIHGTNKPFAIGRRVSSGCIRMYPDAVEDLYERVGVGTKVIVVDQPVKLGWIGGELYMEAHPTGTETDDVTFGKRTTKTMSKAVEKQVTAIAGADRARLDWKLVRKTASEQLGYPIRITTRPANFVNASAAAR